MPAPRILSGSFVEDTPFAIYALMQRDDDLTDLDPDLVTGFTMSVYDLDGDTPDTAFWEATYTVGEVPTYYTTRQAGVGAAPSGYTFKYQFFLPAATLDDSNNPFATTGGRTYRFVVTTNSATLDIDGSKTIWELACRSVYNS